MANQYPVDPNESCADCAYHHCKKSCFEDGKESCTEDGECLFSGKKNVRCWHKRCEHFKQWRPKE